MATTNAAQTHGQAVATCYNCGAFDHYMMSCPEPTRPVPAGLAAARAAQASQPGQYSQGNGFRHGPPPFKKQKTHSVVTKFPGPPAPPVVTRYFPQGVPQGPSPPLGQWGPSAPPYQQPQYPAQPQGYGYGPQHVAPFQGPFVQPVAPYGHGPAQYASAPTQGAPPMMQNAFQPEYQYPPNMPPQQYSHVNHGSTHRHSSYHGQTPSPGWHAPQRHNSWGPNLPTGQHPIQQPYAPQYQQMPHQLQQGPQNTFQSPQQQPHSQNNTPVPNFSSHASPANSDLPPTPAQVRSVSVPVADLPLQPPGEQDDGVQYSDEELYEWDLSCAFREIPFIAAAPMAYPLGNVHHEERIPQPTAGTSGLTSRYVHMASVEVWSKHIRESLHWQNMQQDPAFSNIHWDAPYVSLVEMIEYTRSLTGGKETITQDDGLISHEDSVHHDNVPQIMKKRSRSSSIPNGDDGRHNQEDLQEKRQRRENKKDDAGDVTAESHSTPAPAIDDAWVPQVGEISAKSSTLDESTEALLASLGVTGVPKPVKDDPDFQVHIATLRSLDEATTGLDKDVSPPGENQQYRKDHRYGSTRGTYHENSGSKRRQNSGSHNHRKPWKGNAHPPPPPPLKTLRNQNDGGLDSPVSQNSLQQYTREGTVPLEDFPEPGSSPLSPTSAELLGHLPASQVNEDQQDSKKNTDGGPKLKRKQPKVADAYSRRW